MTATKMNAQDKMLNRLDAYLASTGGEIRKTLAVGRDGIDFYDVFIAGEPQDLEVFCHNGTERTRIADRLAIREKRIPIEHMRFQLWTYDVWGNSRDGYEVNNRFLVSIVAFKVRGKVYNAGEPMEFISYEPTDMQINRALGCQGVKWEGDSDFTIYGERERDRYPEGELERIQEEKD